jgi:hypothetical protein
MGPKKSQSTSEASVAEPVKRTASEAAVDDATDKPDETTTVAKESVSVQLPAGWKCVHNSVLIFEHLAQNPSASIAGKP